MLVFGGVGLIGWEEVLFMFCFSSGVSETFLAWSAQEYSPLSTITEGVEHPIG